jgi:hypothetical protein
MIELAAGVQDGHDDFGGADTFFVHSDRDAAAIVLDSHRTVEVDNEAYLLAEPCEVLIDSVINYFPDQVMEA